MPGVLMLEALVQSAAWLVHATEGFRHSLVTLDEVKSATYKSFLKPGDQLRLDVTAKRFEAASSEFVGFGLRDETEVLRCRLSLRHVNLAHTDPRLAELDARIIADNRERWTLLGGTELTESRSESPVGFGPEVVLD
jgi:3-hydroxyacyl-[acyl-carrier-protein] dehydratase